MTLCHVCGERVVDVWTSAIDVEYGSVPDRFRYLRCEQCDALSIDPLPADRLEEIYPPTYYSFAAGESTLNDESNPVVRVKAALDSRVFRRTLARLAGGKERIRILDVGGGAGQISAALVAVADGRAEATVVDFDPPSIEAARERGLKGFVGRIEEYETSERFDLILMLNLIEHVADPVSVLRRARELLAPDGVVWIQTPNFRSLDARIFRRRNWAGLHCPRHWVVFSDQGLNRALERSGLATVELRHTQGGAFWAASILGLRRRPRARGDSLPKPLVQYRAFLPLAALGAAFDFMTRRFRPTSQLIALARLP